MRRTCNVSLRFHELVEVGLHKRKPLLDTSFDVSTALSHITEDYLASRVRGAQYRTGQILTSSGKAKIGIGFSKDLQI